MSTENWKITWWCGEKKTTHCYNPLVNFSFLFWKFSSAGWTPLILEGRMLPAGDNISFKLEDEIAT